MVIYKLFNFDIVREVLIVFKMLVNVEIFLDILVLLIESGIV